MKHLFCISVFVCCLASFSSADQCYNQLGGAMGQAWQPCNTSASVNPGACCNIQGGDICTEGGLCMRQSTLPGFFYQDGCTDVNNDVKLCPQFCPGKQSAAWAVQACNDHPNPGTFCCKQSKDSDCCSNATAVFTTNIGKMVMPTVTSTVILSPEATTISGEATTISGSVFVSTATITATVTTTTGSPDASPNANALSTSATGPAYTPYPGTCPKDSTAVVGAGVGASLGVAFLAALGLLFWRERTRPKFGDGAYPEMRQSPEMLLRVSRTESGRWATGTPRSGSSRRSFDGREEGLRSNPHRRGDNLARTPYTRGEATYQETRHGEFNRSLSAGRETLRSPASSQSVGRGSSGRRDAVQGYEQSSNSSGGGHRSPHEIQMPPNSNSSRDVTPISRVTPTSSSASRRDQVSEHGIGQGLEFYPNPGPVGGSIEVNKFLRPHELQSMREPAQLP